MIIDRKQLLDNILNSKQKELEARDLEILKNRDKKYIPVKIQKRRITTEFGQLIFKRRIYKFFNEKNKKYEYISLLDQEMGIKKWSKLDESLIQQIKSQICSGKRYRDIADMFQESQVSLMSISRIFKKMDINQLIYDLPKIKVPKRQIIYINADDTFVNVRLNNKIKQDKVRVVTFNLGLDNDKKRHKLKNKKYFFLLNEDKKETEELANEIWNWGKKFFDGFENCFLVVGGDGAWWIKELASWLGAKYVLDKYHASKQLREAFRINSRWPKINISNWNLYRTTLNYFEQGMYEELITVLTEFSSKRVVNYFKANKNGVENFGEPWNIGVSAESDVSKLVKSSLGYGSKIYSSQVFHTMLYSRANKFNNLNC